MWCRSAGQTRGADLSKEPSKISQVEVAMEQLGKAIAAAPALPADAGRPARLLMGLVLAPRMLFLLADGLHERSRGANDTSLASPALPVSGSRDGGRAQRRLQRIDKAGPARPA